MGEGPDRYWLAGYLAGIEAGVQRAGILADRTDVESKESVPEMPSESAEDDLEEWLDREDE